MAVEVSCSRFIGDVLVPPLSIPLPLRISVASPVLLSKITSSGYSGFSIAFIPPPPPPPPPSWHTHSVPHQYSGKRWVASLAGSWHDGSQPDGTNSAARLFSCPLRKLAPNLSISSWFASFSHALVALVFHILVLSRYDRWNARQTWSSNMLWCGLGVMWHFSPIISLI